jgi:uncharacterized caspase-like protein
MTPGSEPIDRSGSQAVLIGVSTYHDPAFPPIPAAANSLREMQRILVDPRLCVWPADQVTTIRDPVDWRPLLTKLRRLARDTTGALMLYFVGHGTMTPASELVLAVTDTIADDADVTGLVYSWVRAALEESPAKVKAVILDCCYSGRAIAARTVDVLGEEEYLADRVDVRGTYTLTAADRQAHAGRHDTCTAFTGAFVDLVRDGIPGGPPVLTFSDLYPCLQKRPT